MTGGGGAGVMPPADRQAEAPRLETPRLILRGHSVGDFGPSARMWADPSVVRHIGGRPSTREEAWFRLLRYAGLWRLLGYGYWVVEDKVTGAFLGEVGLADFQRDLTGTAPVAPEVGWVLAPAAQGRGIATEAMVGVLAWADRRLDAPSTACLLDPAHAASRRVAEKLGYVDAGVGYWRASQFRVMRRPRVAAPESSPATGTAS